jgi:hypothetical protein
MDVPTFRPIHRHKRWNTCKEMLEALWCIVGFPFRSVSLRISELNLHISPPMRHFSTNALISCRVMQGHAGSQTNQKITRLNPLLMSRTSDYRCLYYLSGKDISWYISKINLQEDQYRQSSWNVLHVLPLKQLRTVESFIGFHYHVKFQFHV